MPTTGARFGTVREKVCVALSPPESVIVTDIVAVPCDTAWTVSLIPLMLAVAIEVSEEAAV